MKNKPWLDPNLLIDLEISYGANAEVFQYLEKYLSESLASFALGLITIGLSVVLLYFARSVIMVAPIFSGALLLMASQSLENKLANSLNMSTAELEVIFRALHVLRRQRRI